MNTYQVILPSSDILKVRADRVERDGPYLYFYEADGATKAQFASWIGWNLLEPATEGPDRTPVCDLPTGRN